MTKDYDIIKYNEKLYSAYDKSGREFTKMWRVENNSAFLEAKALNYFTDGGDAFSIERAIEVYTEPSLADVFIVSKETSADEQSKLYCNTTRIGSLPDTEHSAIESISFCKAVALLPPGVVVHRLTGDGDKRILIAPEWVKDKKRTLNLIQSYIAQA